MRKKPNYIVRSIAFLVLNLGLTSLLVYALVISPSYILRTLAIGTLVSGSLWMIFVGFFSYRKTRVDSDKRWAVKPILHRGHYVILMSYGAKKLDGGFSFRFPYGKNIHSVWYNKIAS